MSKLEKEYFEDIHELPSRMSDDVFLNWVKDKDNTFIYRKYSKSRKGILSDTLKIFEKLELFERCQILKDEIDKL